MKNFDLIRSHLEYGHKVEGNKKQEGDEERTWFTEDDKVCPHCGGAITPHFTSRIVRWCDDCGANNPKSPPKTSLTFDDNE